MPEDETPASKLVDRIMSSPYFRNAEQRKRLFLYLLRRRDRSVTRQVILEDLFPKLDENAVGQQCDKLRKALEAFAAAEGATEKWRCTLPKAQRGDGYQLRLTYESGLPGPTGAFWEGHVHGTEPLLVYNEELIFFDIKSGFTLHSLHPGNQSDPKEAHRILQAAFDALAPPGSIPSPAAPVHVHFEWRSGSQRAYNRVVP